MLFVPIGSSFLFQMLLVPHLSLPDTQISFTAEQRFGPSVDLAEKAFSSLAASAKTGKESPG